MYQRMMTLNAHHSPSGLTQTEAAGRLARYGTNVIQRTSRRGLFAIAGGTLRQPIFLLLLVAAALYLIFGNPREGFFLLAGASLSLGMVIVQELRSEHALEALNALAEPVAHVIREGHTLAVPARDLVPGDLLVVAEGSRMPADAMLVHGDALVIDESALTGEAAAVTKWPTKVSDGVIPSTGAEPDAELFAGTMIVRGQGSALVTRTGAATRFGKIGIALATATEDPTLLQRSFGRLIARLGALALLFCLAISLSYGWLKGDWFQGALYGITLAISMLPEEIPMALAIFMALGAWRLARHNVLVRRSAVIETLGATTLLCVDKTGTITENRMTLRYVWHPEGLFDLETGQGPESVRAILTAAQRASAVRPHDPMDMAVHLAVGHVPSPSPLRSYPLRPDFLVFVQVWPSEQADGVVYAMKGAPETVLRLCPGAGDPNVQSAIQMLGEKGMRVLAVADAHFSSDPKVDPASLAYTFKGLLAFVDPVRSDVADAIAQAGKAGIQVAMITGDYPATAVAASQAAGISTTGGVLTGADIAALPDLAERLSDVRVFARIMPEQKLKLVEAFKAAGHVVAMTGDGINDAPALAVADVGIAMGRRGTDVAREASDLILLDDRFASIVGGISLGRRIFANLRRAMIFIAAIHVPIAGLALLPLLTGLPPLLYPMHLVLLELLLDPLCSLAFESAPSEAAAMSEPPRRADESLFGRRQTLLAAVQGTVLLASVLALYVWATASGLSEAAARATGFIALVLGNLSLALAESSSGSAIFLDRRKITFWIIGGVALIVLALCLTVPALRDILRFSPPPFDFLLYSLLVGFAAGGWFRLASMPARNG